MGFFMDGLDAEAYDRQYSDRELVKRIVSYFRPQLPRMVIVATAVVLTAGVDVLLPIIISRSLDTLQNDPASANLLLITGLMTVVASLSWVFNMLRQWLSAEAVGNVVLNLREDAVDAITERDLSFYDTFPSGKIVSRVTSDTAAFAQVVVLTIDLMSRILLVGFLLIYLATVSTKMTLVLVTISPFVMGAALGFRKIARD
jgi:ABC-type multidrug transport system fused ATPase/permease subunit